MKYLFITLLITISTATFANENQITGNGLCFNSTYHDPDYVFDCAMSSARVNAKNKCEGELVQVSDWFFDYERGCNYCPIFSVTAYAKFDCL